MKSIVSVLLLLGLNAFAGTVTLSPGSEATVEAGERMTVRCEGPNSPISNRRVICSFIGSYTRVTLRETGLVIGGSFQNSQAGLKQCNEAIRVSQTAFCSFIGAYVQITSIPTGNTIGGTFESSSRGLQLCNESIRD